MSITLKARGFEAEARLPEWGDLLAFERAKEKNEFQAMRDLWKKVRVSGGDGMPAALEVSFVAAVLKQAGSGIEVRLVEDEFEYPADLAEAMVRLPDRGPFHVFETCGLYVLTREPKNAEMEAFWKQRDKSQLLAAHGLVKAVTLFVTGAPADKPLEIIETSYPAIFAALAVAVSEVGGLTLEVEVGKS